jgi:hypothetical protein
MRYREWLVTGIVALGLLACTADSDDDDNQNAGGTVGWGTSGSGGSGASTAAGGSATGGASGQQELADGTVGSSCGTCQAGFTCITGADVPNGYCSKLCTSHPDCGQGAYCYADGDANICLRACGGDLDCRPGYSCQGDPGITVCYPTTTGTGGTGGSGGGDVTAQSIRGCWALNGDITFQLWFDGNNYFKDISYNPYSGSITYDGNYEVGGGKLYLNYSDGTNKVHGVQFDGQNLYLDSSRYVWAGETCS